MPAQPLQTPTVAVYPGSFDPVTLGHVDIAKRAAADCDHLIVSVGRNAAKTPLFSASERMDMLRQALAPHPKITVESFEGGVAHYARQRGAHALVRGVRNLDDRIHETIMMVVNFFLGWGLPTRFYQASPELLHVSSSQARARAQQGEPLADWVPAPIVRQLELRARAANPTNGPACPPHRTHETLGQSAGALFPCGAHAH